MDPREYIYLPIIEIIFKYKYPRNEHITEKYCKLIFLLRKL